MVFAEEVWEEEQEVMMKEKWQVMLEEWTPGAGAGSEGGWRTGGAWQ